MRSIVLSVITRTLVKVAWQVAQLSLFRENVIFLRSDLDRLGNKLAIALPKIIKGTKL